MSVSSTTNKVSHFYNGATRVFPFSFRIISQNDLKVTVLRFGGQVFDLVLGQDYIVSGVNFSSGGNITVLNSFSLEVEDTIKIQRSVYAYTQDTVFRNQGAFYADTVEDALDKLTMMSQELKTKIELVPTFADTDLNANYEFPAPVSGAYIRWATRLVGGVTEYYLSSSTIQATDLPTVPLSKGGTGSTTASGAWLAIAAGGSPTLVPANLAASAALGSSTNYARQDHVHAFPTLLNLNAAARGANTDITSVALTTGTISTAPSASADIANKAYVDAKAPTPIRTVGFVTTSASIGQQFTSTTITGTSLQINQISAISTLSVGDRVLVAAQNDAVQNGIYSLTQGGLPWVLTRTSDWAVGKVVTLNDLVYVSNNSFSNANATSTFYAPNVAGVVGDAGILWNQVSGRPSDTNPLVDGASASAGSSPRVARADHVHPRSTPGDIGAAAAGTNTDISSVALTTGTITAIPTSNSAIANKLYVDNKASSTTPLANAGAGTVGTSTSFARADHVHPASAITSVELTTGTISTAPSGANDIANKAYVDGIAQGINYHQAVALATTVNLGSTLSGNVLTGDTVNSALVIDNGTPTIGERILVKNQTTASQNGIYTLTRLHTASLAWQLTRAIDYDSVGSGVDQITQGDFILVVSGTVNTNTAWVLQTSGAITLNTTNLTFSQFAGASTAYTAGAGLTLTGNSFSLATPVTIARGGTGATTQQAAINALAGALTSGRFLRGDGTNVTMDTIKLGDLPAGVGTTYTAGTGLTLTGTAFSITAPVTIALGGTGGTSQQAAINSLAGAVTAGSYLRGNGSNVLMSTIQAADLPSLAGDVTGTIGATSVSKLGGYNLTVGTPSDFSTFVFNEQTNAIELSTRMSDLLGYSASQPSVNIGLGSLVRQQSAVLASGLATLVVVTTSNPTIRTGAIALHHGPVYRAGSNSVVAQFQISPFTNILTI